MKRLILPALLAILAASPARADEEKKEPKKADTKAVQDFVFFGDARPLLVRLHISLDGKPFRAAWADFVGKIFKDLDKNKDGSLDRDEASRTPYPGSLTGGGVYAVPQPVPGGVGGTTLEAIDRDKDGKVAPAEFEDYFRKNGFQPFQMGGNSNQNGRYIRRIAYDSMGGATPSADALNQAILKLLDANKDGKLSRKELADAPRRLLKMDADDDEMVNSGEVLGQAPSSGDYGGVMFVEQYMDASMPAGSPFVAVTPGELARLLVTELQKRYGTKKGKPGNKLTRQDIGVDEAAFKALDADGDGSLDSEELARFARRPADLELTYNLGKNEEVTVGPSKAALAGLKVDRNEDGEVVVELGNTRLQLRVDKPGAGGGLNFADTDQFVKMQFGTADGDNNGYLDQNEARRTAFGGTFAAMDADSDGMLYLKEILAYQAKQKDLQKRAGNSSVAMSVADQGKGLFDLFDKSGDGRLSVREIRDAIKLVEKLDQDKDEAIATTEIPRRYQVNVRRAGPGSGGFGGVVVFSGIGGSPFGDMKPEPTAGPLWFRKMDRNRDGDVSVREFLGTAEVFSKIDLDSDDLLSADEADKADALFRKKK